MVICSEITAFSLEKHEWSKITRNSNRSSATIQNKRDGNMEWLHLGMVLIMEEETLGLGKDHRKVYWTDGKNIAGCYLRLDWEVEQQRNCFLTLAADRTRMPLNLAEMITVGTHVCK
ncbi:uncharacterized protein LOC133668313 isoform X2 [Populus nigra]|uniref:uncharacterized protein LOC133668313 isoform X2 n=1 Tax=Populus nigra TaxID=3691 RepID=UPI002B26E3B0|nr:uncharacterized protein LOC133668313 isoform X2 [Populus nigra]